MNDLLRLSSQFFRFKLFLVGVFVLATSVLVSVFFLGALEGRPHFLLLFFSALVLFPALFLLQTAFSFRVRFVYVLIFLETFIPALVFIPFVRFGTLSLLLLASVCFFVLLMHAHRDGVKSLENSLVLNFGLFAKVTYRHAATGVVAFVAFVGYLMFFIWSSGSASLPYRFLSFTLMQNERVLTTYLPGASFSQSVDDFLRVLVEAQLKRQSLPLSLGDTSSAAYAQVVSNAVSNLKLQFEKFSGPLDGKISIVDALVQAIQSFFSRLPQQFHLPLSILGFVMVFWVLKSTLSLFSFLGVFIAWLIYKLFLVSGFVRIEKQMREQEVLVL